MQTSASQIMKNVLLVRIAIVYGRPLYYPENDQAHRLASFAGVAAFQEHHLKALHAMGFKIEESKGPELKLPDFTSLDTYADSHEKSSDG